MKKVLVVGSESYIGCSFEKYAHGRLDVTTVDARDNKWQKIDYSGFDSVVYVAGIAHRKQTQDNKDLYFRINRDLAVSVAEKAKAEDVGQFIYLSSIAIYGIRAGEITKNTVPSPPDSDYYGLSKYQAEKRLEPMQTADFKIAIIRPPMVYGYNCRGKFRQLVQIAKMTPFIPTLQNKRSMIYIDNLTELMAIAVEKGVSGVLCPQNKEYVCTSEMLEKAAKGIGKPCRRLPLMNLFIYGVLPLSHSIQTAFGSLHYHIEVSKMPFEQNYQVVDFEESVKKSIQL